MLSQIAAMSEPLQGLDRQSGRQFAHCATDSVKQGVVTGNTAFYAAKNNHLETLIARKHAKLPRQWLYSFMRSALTFAKKPIFLVSDTERAHLQAATCQFWSAQSGSKIFARSLGKLSEIHPASFKQNLECEEKKWWECSNTWIFFSFRTIQFHNSDGPSHCVKDRF